MIEGTYPFLNLPPWGQVLRHRWGEDKRKTDNKCLNIKRLTSTGKPCLLLVYSLFEFSNMGCTYFGTREGIWSLCAFYNISTTPNGGKCTQFYAKIQTRITRTKKKLSTL